MRIWLAALLLAGPAAAADAPPQILNIAADAPQRPFPHSWERMFGSGRAILSLRDSYRQDLRAVAAASSRSAR